jgi:hypothetical protein
MTATILCDYNLIFVHIPKTAGISISKWLSDAVDPSRLILSRGGFLDYDEGDINRETLPDHSSLPTLIQKYGNIEKSFAVVRNPWDRAVSMYHYAQQVYTLRKLFPNVYRNPDLKDEYLENLTWDIFIDRIDEYENTITNQWFKPSTNQTEWIPDGVTYLLRFESLDDDILQIGELINHKVTLPKLHTTQHDHYQTYFNDEHRKKIGKIFEKDVDTFQYIF